MRRATILILLSTSAWAQALVEHAAAAAGGTVGGIAGKKVNDAITGIFDKVGKQTATAAGETTKPSKPKAEPMMEVGPGAPDEERTSAKSGAPSVPPPPPLPKSVIRKPAPVHTAMAPPPQPIAAPPPPPPPPLATAEDLRNIAIGSKRDDLLKLGFPAIHITMFENGHLVESFRFLSGVSDVGVVRLSDGMVTVVQVN